MCGRAGDLPTSEPARDAARWVMDSESEPYAESKGFEWVVRGVPRPGDGGRTGLGGICIVSGEFVFWDTWGTMEDLACGAPWPSIPSALSRDCVGS